MAWAFTRGNRIVVAINTISFGLGVVDSRNSVERRSVVTVHAQIGRGHVGKRFSANIWNNAAVAGNALAYCFRMRNNRFYGTPRRAFVTSVALVAGLDVRCRLAPRGHVAHLMAIRARPSNLRMVDLQRRLPLSRKHGMAFLAQIAGRNVVRRLSAGGRSVVAIGAKLGA